MITHDVDEAIYLADKIFLMTNGPGAVLAEIVENPLPKERGRIDLHRHPYYYALRNHIVDFLVSRSKTFAADNRPRSAPRADGADRQAGTSDCFGIRRIQHRRHGRACPGHPRLPRQTSKTWMPGTFE